MSTGLPSCEQSHCLQTRNPCHDRPVRRHTFHLLLAPQKFSLSSAMLYNWSEHSRSAEKKSIAPIILLINPMVNQPPGSTNCINNATKLIHTGWHPSTVPVCNCGSTITKTRSAHCWITQEYKFHRDQAKACDQAAAEWARAQDAGPTPILLWPRARHRGADDTWSGWSWVQWHLSRHKVC